MRVSWSRAVSLQAVAVLAAALMTACTGGDDPAAEGTPTPKFSEAPSESASGSSESPSASGSSAPEPQTPEQVARAFVKGVGRAINSGDTDEFMRYATNKCSNCRVVADNVIDIYENGRSARSQGWAVSSLKRDEVRGDLVFLSGSVDAGRQVLVRRNGSVYKRETAATLRQELRLRRRDGEWLITGWNLS